MKYFATIVVLAGFAGIALFGVSFMGHSMMHQSGCIASAITGGPCPTNVADFLSHHIAAVQAFFISLPPIFGKTPLLFMLLVFSILLMLGTRPYAPPKLFPFRVLRRRSNHRVHTDSVLYWLALFEHSPSS